MSNDTIPRVISKSEVRAGDTVRLTFEEPTLTRELTFKVVKSVGGWFHHSESGSIDGLRADTITLLERPKREIKVGDLVRRERRNGVTIEFTVHRVCDGFIYPAYDADGETNRVGYNPDHFEVVE